MRTRPAIRTRAHFLPVDVAGKMFIVLTLFLLGAALIGLNVALSGLLFMHSEIVTPGFVIYLVGVGHFRHVVLVDDKHLSQPVPAELESVFEGSAVRLCPSVRGVTP